MTSKIAVYFVENLMDVDKKNFVAKITYSMPLAAYMCT